MSILIQDTKEGRIYFKDDDGCAYICDGKIPAPPNYQRHNHIRYSEKTNQYTVYRRIGDALGCVDLWSTASFEDALDWLLRKEGCSQRTPHTSVWGKSG